MMGWVSSRAQKRQAEILEQRRKATDPDCGYVQVPGGLSGETLAFIAEIVRERDDAHTHIRDLQQALRTEREAKEAYKARLERAEGVIRRLSRDMPGMWLRQEEISPSADPDTP